MIKVSVVVTVYNGEKYIRECMDSILSQSLKEIEIICVDDASTDRTKNILEEYLCTADNMKLLINEVNSYAGAARNRGLAVATGEYVIFLDADDRFECDMLEQAYQKAILYDADICIVEEDQFIDGQEDYMDYPYVHKLMENLSEQGSFAPDEVKNMVFGLWNGWAWDKLFKRSYVVKMGLQFQNLRTSNDAFFVHAAIASAEKLVLVHKVLVHHRINNRTSLSNTRGKSWKACFLYLKALREYLIRHEIYTKYEKSFVNWACDFLYWNYQTLDEESRAYFFVALQEEIFDELDIKKYGEAYFDNRFSYFFIQRVAEAKKFERCGLPISERDKYKWIYQSNRERIEQFLDGLNCQAAIWGAGERGRAFTAIYGENPRIEKVFDKNMEKQGSVLENKLPVEVFTSEGSRDIGCIIVLNATHILGVNREVFAEKSDMYVFDMASYITFPLETEICTYRQ